MVNARFLTQPITGVQRFAIEISKELKKIGENIIFVSPYNIIDKELANELDTKIIGNRTGHSWEKIDLLLFLHQNNKPFLVNLCNSSPLLYFNQILTLHDMAVFENPSWFSRTFRILYKIMIPIIAKTSRRIITVSEFSKKEIIKYLGISATNIDVIHNGVTECICKQEFYNPQFGNYILCVGSIEPRKNLLNLIKAFKQAIVPKDYKLVIVGGKNKLFRLDNLQIPFNDSLIERIKFTGYVNDEQLSYLYKNAQVFIYPSLYEGFGIPPLEAMLHSCPTIVSNISSLPEICGSASLYVNPIDANDIASKLSQLVQNRNSLKENLIENGKRQVAKYSWEKSALKLYTIIQTQLS